MSARRQPAQGTQRSTRAQHEQRSESSTRGKLHDSAEARPCCKHCNKPLRRAEKAFTERTGRSFGLYADDTFCNASCGYLWACDQLGVPTAMPTERVPSGATQ